MSSNITVIQLKNIADDLAMTGQHLAAFLTENAASMTPLQRKNSLARMNDLFIKSVEVRQRATAIDLGDAVMDLPNIISATKEAKRAVRNINAVKSVIKVATGLLSFAAAIATGNVKDILQEGKDLYDLAKDLNEGD